MPCSDFDQDLLKRCMERDPSAWDTFVSAGRSLIVSSIRIRLHKYGLRADPHDIEDILQDILSEIWEGERLKEIRNPASVKYWLAIVSGNIALQYMRRRMRISRKTISISDIDESALAGTPGSHGPHPEEESLESSIQDRLSMALERLPASWLLALKLNALHGKSYAEISEMMSVPAGTVSSYICRAKERMRKRLGREKF